MVFNPAILALVGGSVVISFLMLYSSAYGALIIRKWDLSSGSELQLSLEKRTYLISTMMSYALGFQLISLFLFIYTADNLSSLFTGAMCAAGTLNVNRFGYAVFLLKIFTFVLSGLWIIINYTDNKAYDYPLIRVKYLFLLFIMPVVMAEAVIQALYFFGLEADVITSCCGSLFSNTKSSVASSIFDFSPSMALVIFYSAGIFFVLSGIYFLKTENGSYLFSVVGLFWFVVSTWTLLQSISLYIYELPTHHCPFCMLKKEYGYVGYLYYLTALCGCILSIGTGMLHPFRNITSLTGEIPVIQKRLAFVSVVCSLLFIAVSVYTVLFSGFRID